MEQHWSGVCPLILTLSAFVHHGIAFPDRCLRDYVVFGQCEELCSTDSDCLNDDKCCSNGCGHVCTAPYIVKPGLCPAPQGITPCAFLCNHDGQCPGDQKCCMISCGVMCRDPY
uniref:WAP domain-containing protein n=1 Tax=Gasterosteus aculeatus aculeatus TaxID=481459 RepID=A0AAQ4PAD5_GASAC